MQCRDLREIADSYLKDELLVETNHDVMRHLESCADCQGELAARRELRERLRIAFARQPEMQPSDEFVNRLQAQLRSHERGERFFSNLTSRNTWLAVAACLVLAGAFGLRRVQQQQLEQQPTSGRIATDVRTDSGGDADGDAAVPTLPTPQSPSVPSVGADREPAAHAALAGLTAIAVGDHRNCAVAFRLKRKPINLEAASRRYDVAYSGLTTAVMFGRKTSADVQFVKSHSCVFENQRFGHVILKHQGRLVSVLITDLDDSENATPEQGDSSGDTAERVVTCPQVNGYHASCFNTARHAVFVISDLDEAGNRSVARALAPSVYKRIQQNEKVT